MIFPELAAILATAPLFVLAQNPLELHNNLTLDFYPEHAVMPSSDEEVQPGLVAQTSTVPDGLTCINLEELFNSSTGPGSDWYIPDRSAEYDSSKNYSGVSYRQHNSTDSWASDEEGKDGRFVVSFYPSPDCDVAEDKASPWFETSCQTTWMGEPQTLPYSIRSFSVRGYLPDEFGDCQTWAQFGAAPALAGPRASVAVIAAVMAGFFFL